MFTRLRSSGTKTKVEPDGELVSSGLLAELLEGIEDRDRTVVLDVGSGAQSTLDFFSRHNGRIHFVDLFECELLTDPPEELDVATAERMLAEYLKLPDDVSFDLCLFWDAFLRMDLVAVEGFSRVLTPHLHGGTRGYGFGNLHAKGLENCRYGIHDAENLEVRTLGTPYEGPFYPHAQQQLDTHFPCLAIQRATLLRGGRLELLFGSD